MDKAVRQVITQHPTFVDMMAKQAKYDGPPTSPNPDPDSVFTSSDPDGTDHGKTQEATFRLP